MTEDDSFGECLARLDRKQDLVDALEMIATSEGKYWLNKIATEKEWSKSRTTSVLEDLTEMRLISERGFVGRQKPYVITEKGKRVLNWLREHKEDIGNAVKIKEMREEDEHIQKSVKDYIIEVLIEERHRCAERLERFETEAKEELKKVMVRSWHEANIRGMVKALSSSDQVPPKRLDVDERHPPSERRDLTQSK